MMIRRDLSKIYELVRDDIKPIVKGLVDDGKKWEKCIDKYQQALIDCPIENLKEHKKIFDMLRASETQYTNIVKLLLSALKHNEAPETDEFEEYMKENGL